MLDIQTIKNAGSNCFHYICNSIQPDGRFIYEWNTETAVPSESYNILRHAGALYTAYQWLQMFPNEIDKLPILELGCQYFLKQIQPHDDSLCIVEENTIKLGGAALGLLMMIERRKVCDVTSKEDSIMAGLSKFLISMQQKDGKFISKLFFDSRDDSGFSSTYYPGQAILALYRFSKLDPDPSILISVWKGTRFLLQNPAVDKLSRKVGNHWFIIALSEICKDHVNEENYNEMYAILQLIIDSIDKNFKLTEKGKTDTRFFSAGPLATRGEAITATALLERYLENEFLVFELAKRAESIINYCRSLQVTESEDEQNFSSKGGILTSQTERSIRIDNVQHVLQLLMNYLILYQ